MSTIASTKPGRRLQPVPRPTDRAVSLATPYRDGEPFDTAQSRWPDMTVYGFRHGAHQLRLFRTAPDAATETAVRSGGAAVRLVPRGPLTLLQVRLTTTAAWDYAPVSWWLLPDAEARALPAGDAEAPLRIVLIDSRSGLVRASGILHRALRVRRGLWHTLRAQSAQPGTLLEVAAALRMVQTGYVATDAGTVACPRQ